MKIIMNVILVVLAFGWVSGVSADKGVAKPSPESVVTCQAGGPQMYMVVAMSLPGAINTEQCIQSSNNIPRHCAPCIVSLENQGCKTVDVVMGTSNDTPIVTYHLSCAKP